MKEEKNIRNKIFDLVKGTLQKQVTGTPEFLGPYAPNSFAAKIQNAKTDEERIRLIGSLGMSLGADVQPISGVSISSLPAKGSVEQIAESGGGWQSGTKAIFDNALLHGDKAAVQRLLPFVPQNYQARFATEINNLLKGVEETFQGTGVVPAPPNATGSKLWGW
ncbi:MAG: hypothetical protein LAN71_17830 [Acidobacteriia bacterium]|nr:hypothetical protein [Terriglobia bacterium]